MHPNPNRMIHFSQLRRPRLLVGIAAVLVIGGGWFGYRKFCRTQAAAVPAEDADAWMEERLEKEAQRERTRLHARPPGKRKFWGR